MGKQRTLYSKEQLLSHIRQGDDKVLNRLYNDYRERFLRWAMGRYQCNDDAAAEVYQKAFTILYFNIKNNKVTELTSSLETYLFGIGKNVFRERYKDKFNQVQSIDERFDLKEVDMTIIDKHQKIHQRTAVHGLLEQLGEPCNSILLLYYYRKFSMESIAREVGYKNEAVAKKKKYQCLQGLRKMVGNSAQLREQLLG